MLYSMAPKFRSNVEDSALESSMDAMSISGINEIHDDIDCLTPVEGHDVTIDVVLQVLHSMNLDITMPVPMRRSFHIASTRYEDRVHETFAQAKRPFIGLSEQQLMEHTNLTEKYDADLGPHIANLMRVKSVAQANSMKFALCGITIPDTAGLVAVFVGDCMSDGKRVTFGSEVAPDAQNVRGDKVLSRPVMIGGGRAGFEFRDDSEISTPRSSITVRDTLLRDPMAWT